MKDASIQNALARLMLTGVVISAVLMLVGLGAYLAARGSQPEGDKIFTGEPSYFRNPVEMVGRALDFGMTGERRSIIQIGVFLLLLNPILRVALAAGGFAAQRDWLYAGASLVVLAILALSFFA